MNYVSSNYEDEKFCGLNVSKVYFCGETCFAQFIESSNTLKIFGSGEMNNFNEYESYQNEQNNQNNQNGNLL